MNHKLGAYSCMIRATTPTHKFVFSVNISEFLKKILITYSQNGNIVLEKTESDLEIVGNSCSFTLSQEETLLFSSKSTVQVQVRAISQNNKALASQKYFISVEDVLNEVIL